jgi:hypothetical protein
MSNRSLKRDAMAAWRRFVSCVRSLPADQAAALWEIALAEFPQLSGEVGELPRPVGPKVLASLLLLSSLAMFAAIRRASSLLSNLAVNLCCSGWKRHYFEFAGSKTSAGNGAR